MGSLASQGSRGCSQLSAAAIGAFQGCGVRIGLLQPAASFVSNKNQRFESAAQGGEGGFFRAPGPGLGASMGAGVRPWSLPGGAPRHQLLPQCLPHSSAGETEAQAAPPAGMAIRARCSPPLQAWYLKRVFFCIQSWVFFMFQNPCCFARVFCKRREGEVLQVQKTCTCFLKPSLTSGAW